MLPIGRKVLTSNATKNIARTAGKTLKKAAVETALDMIDGESFQDSAKKRLATTKRNVAKAIKKHAIEELSKNPKKVKYHKKRSKKNQDYFLLK